MDEFSSLLFYFVDSDKVDRIFLKVFLKDYKVLFDIDTSIQYNIGFISYNNIVSLFFAVNIFAQQYYIDMYYIPYTILYIIWCFDNKYYDKLTYQNLYGS